MKSNLPIIVSLLLAAPALAKDPAPAADGSTPIVLKAKMVCRSQSQTGSRISQSVCLGENEWKRIDDEKAARAASMRKDIDSLTSTNLPKDTLNGPAAMGPNG